MRGKPRPLKMQCACAGACSCVCFAVAGCGIIDALENELPAPDNLAIEDDRDDDDPFASCDE